jgi:hypothetical protein
MPYNAETPYVRQSGDWQCSAASSAWVLQSLGIEWGEQKVVNWLGIGQNISPAVGLFEGSGRMLAEMFRSHGLDAHYGPIGWGEALGMAGNKPFCMSGGNWYHWTGVRKTDGDGLYLANPAPDWRNVQQYMDYDEFRTWGQWNAVWVNVPPENVQSQEDPAVIEDLQQTIDRLQAELTTRTRRDEELISTMGFLHGDVVRAFRAAHAGLKSATEAAVAAGSLPAAVTDELTGHAQAVDAATNTLENNTSP